LKAKELARGLRVPSEHYAAFRDLLERMRDRGELYRTRNGRYSLPDLLNLVVGRLQVVRSGAGFVVPEDRAQPDVFIPAFKLANAAHGDRVVARVEHRPARESPQGGIVRVLERARSRVVGTYRRSPRFAFVQPDDPRLTFDVFVADAGRRAEPGQKVVVEIEDWGDAQKNPEGRVVEVLGFPHEPGVDVLAILHHHGLDPAFPPEVEEAARRLPARIPSDEIARRLDVRDVLSFTIDPENARDFDDALSIVSAGGAGDWEVGVHVADVGHYLDPDGVLDREGRARATSVYLVDRVVPMLPERLSNELCSLNPGEDRLAMSVFVTLDARGEIQASRIAPTVIRSRARLTYAEAQTLLDGGADGGRPPELVAAVRRLRDLSLELRRRRAERGSLDFDLPEAEVVLDADGFPLDIQESVRLDSHRLIEEFMLLANEIVARRLQKRRVAAIYRVHEEPDPLKLQALRDFAAAFGHVLPPGEVTPRVLQRLLQRAEGRPEEKVLNTIVLRAMKQARYSVDNVGHFGLASECYTHFTSPIRRYPDVVVHRLLKDLDAEAAAAEDVKDAARRERGEIAAHASARERVAQEAERDSIDLKKVAFMERHLGETFAGTISGVQVFGFFVRLHRWFVEGLVHVNSIEDDYYLFEEAKYALIGRNTARTFRLGDEVEVTLARVDRDLRRLDFVLAPAGAVGGRGREPTARARGPRRAGRDGGADGAGGAAVTPANGARRRRGGGVASGAPGRGARDGRGGDRTRSGPRDGRGGDRTRSGPRDGRGGDRTRPGSRGGARGRRR
jgi:ribonuclease R